MYKKILVTGGAGYIGSILVPQLLQNGYQVRILDKFLFKNKSFIASSFSKNVQLIEGDIRDKEIVTNSMNEIDTVIHLAAMANDPSGDLDPEITREINYNAYNLLLEEAQKKGVKKFLNASSFSVYGKKDNIEITEEEKTEPLKDYGVYKSKSEKLLIDAATNSFCTVSLRLATVCGWSPRMRFDLIVNQLTALALKNGKLEIWGGEQIRPQIHIRDISNYFIKLIETEAKLINKQVFNAGGENVTIRDISEILQNKLGNKLILEFMPPRLDERSYHVSSEKIKAVLGFQPQYSVSDAMDEIIIAKKSGFWNDPYDKKHLNVKMTREWIDNNLLKKNKYALE